MRAKRHCHFLRVAFYVDEYFTTRVLTQKLGVLERFEGIASPTTVVASASLFRAGRSSSSPAARRRLRSRRSLVRNLHGAKGRARERGGCGGEAFEIRNVRGSVARPRFETETTEGRAERNCSGCSDAEATEKQSEERSGRVVLSRARIRLLA